MDLFDDCFVSIHPQPLKSSLKEKKLYVVAQLLKCFHGIRRYSRGALFIGICSSSVLCITSYASWHVKAISTSAVLGHGKVYRPSLPNHVLSQRLNKNHSLSYISRIASG
jgi:hypothetical protein